jgi:hypothetical protein
MRLGLFSRRKKRKPIVCRHAYTYTYTPSERMYSPRPTTTYAPPPHWVRIHPTQTHVSAFAFSLQRALPTRATFWDDLKYFQLRFSIWVPPTLDDTSLVADPRPCLCTILRLGPALALCFDKRRSVAEFCLLYWGDTTSRWCLPLYGMLSFLQRTWHRGRQLTMQDPPLFALQVQTSYVALFIISDDQKNRVVYNTPDNAFPYPLQDLDHVPLHADIQIGPQLSQSSSSSSSSSPLTTISTNPDHQHPIRALLTNVSWIWSSTRMSHVVQQNWQWSIEPIPEEPVYGKQSTSHPNMISLPPDITATDNNPANAVQIIPSMWKPSPRSEGSSDLIPKESRCHVPHREPSVLVRHSQSILWTGLLLMIILGLFFVTTMRSLYASQSYTRKGLSSFSSSPRPDKIRPT